MRLKNKYQKKAYDQGPGHDGQEKEDMFRPPLDVPGLALRRFGALVVGQLAFLIVTDFFEQRNQVFHRYVSGLTNSALGVPHSGQRGSASARRSYPHVRQIGMPRSTSSSRK